MQFHKQKIDFSGQLSEELLFIRQFHKKFDFLGKFSENFDFSGNFTKKSIFQRKIAHLQPFLGRLIYFSSKVTTFENILRVHDKIY